MTEKILIVDDDLDTLRLVGLMLQKVGYQISAASNGEQGLAKALEERPDLILLDVMMPDIDGYEVTRRLRKNPATSAIPILMFTAMTQLDDKVSGFEVGADDYLTKPTHPTELQNHVKALLARTPKVLAAEVEAQLPEQHGYVIGVLSARGGLGVTTFASNLAAALISRVQDDVIFAELTPGQGTVALDLGLPPQTALNEILEGSVAEVTLEKVKSALVTRNSALKLLLASDKPKDISLAANVRQYEALVTKLSGLARFVILDLGSGLPEFVQSVLPLCSETILILEGLANPIQHTKMLIEDLADLKLERKALHVIVNNRVRNEGQLNVNQVKDKLGHSVASVLTPAPELFAQALKSQTLAVVSQPASVTAQQFHKIAEALIEREQKK
ncbi:MAG: response regulator [Anaerolineales bacterium]|nr:response regulator [Anaerolineales bacterium]MCZ2123043.1 response regulator [Anaerolineales bacterium]